MNDQKNLLLFVVFFLGVMTAWNYFYETPKTERLVTQAQQARSQDGSTVHQPSLPEHAPLETHVKAREEIIAEASRVKIDTPKLKGSINLKGARLDDLVLKNYHETISPKSPEIVVFAPEQTQAPYFAEFGWASNNPALKLPSADTLWQADATDPLGAQDRILTWDNGEGVNFEQKIHLDADYLFTVTHTVVNHTSQPLKLYPYGRITRRGTPQTAGFFILHEGPIGFLNNHLEEFKYDDLKEKKEIKFNCEGGWIGLTDKYWLSALIPAQNKKFEYVFRSNSSANADSYTTGYYGEGVTLAPGERFEFPHHLFAGAKVLDLLDRYEEELGVKHFDLAVDFGWFYFLTKPMFHLLEIFKNFIGNFGLAILLMTVILKLLFFPLANKSYRSMAKMRALQPKMDKIRERHADDKLKLNQELMELYKKEKVNPMAGCLPIIIQIPVFFALYKVLFVSIEMRQAPFYGWIHDLSAPDPTSLFNLFGLIPWTPPSFLMIGAWPIVMGLTMLIQQKLNPAPADPIQAKMFMVMPLVLTVMLAQFPAGLVIYWAWSNMLSILQQWVIMRSTTIAMNKN
jgi:YidC/Oxa1 family membrane protein insertase